MENQSDRVMRPEVHQYHEKEVNSSMQRPIESSFIKYIHPDLAKIYYQQNGA